MESIFMEIFRAAVLLIGYCVFIICFDLAIRIWKANPSVYENNRVKSQGTYQELPVVCTKTNKWETKRVLTEESIDDILG